MIVLITCPKHDGPYRFYYSADRIDHAEGYRLPVYLPLRARLAARVLREYGEISPRLRAIIEACTPDPEEE